MMFTRWQHQIVKAAGRFSLAVTLSLAGVIAGGCGPSAAPAPTAAFQVDDASARPGAITASSIPVGFIPEVSEPGYILHLPGIGGTRTIDVDMLNGLAGGGFKGKYEICDWAGDDPGISALQAYDRNQKKAAEIAKLLTKTFDADPTNPIQITSHSGGGAMAVWILENLPDRVKVCDVVLMSPALSPTYDLSKALKHLTGKMYVFSSTGDLAVLGYGCRMFGTMDGPKVDAAGRVGFTKPATADPVQYQKLVPMPYQREWAKKYYNAGDHIGGMGFLFAKAVLAPLLVPHTGGTAPTIATQTIPVGR